MWRDCGIAVTNIAAGHLVQINEHGHVRRAEVPAQVVNAEQAVFLPPKHFSFTKCLIHEQVIRPPADTKPVPCRVFPSKAHCPVCAAFEKIIFDLTNTASVGLTNTASVYPPDGSRSFEWQALPAVPDSVATGLDQQPAEPHVCTCPMDRLLTSGCTCGGT